MVLYMVFSYKSQYKHSVKKTKTKKKKQKKTYCTLKDNLPEKILLTKTSSELLKL